MKRKADEDPEHPAKRPRLTHEPSFTWISESEFTECIAESLHSVRTTTGFPPGIDRLVAQFATTADHLIGNPNPSWFQPTAEDPTWCALRVREDKRTVDWKLVDRAHRNRQIAVYGSEGYRCGRHRWIARINSAKLLIGVGGFGKVWGMANDCVDLHWGTIYVGPGFEGKDTVTLQTDVFKGAYDITYKIICELDADTRRVRWSVLQSSGDYQTTDWTRPIKAQVGEELAFYVGTSHVLNQIPEAIILESVEHGAGASPPHDP